MSWSNAKLGRVDHADDDCRCPNYAQPHRASYRAEVTNDRGQVERTHLCINRAALFAQRFGITFPPGRWQETP